MTHMEICCEEKFKYERKQIPEQLPEINPERGQTLSRAHRYIKKQSRAREKRRKTAGILICLSIFWVEGRPEGLDVNVRVGGRVDTRTTSEHTSSCISQHRKMGENGEKGREGGRKKQFKWEIWGSPHGTIY